MANKNTELEQELLNELLKIETLLMTLRKTRDITVKVAEMMQLNIILKKIKETYPSVRFPVDISGGFGACVYDFIMSLQPVFDRLKSQAEVEVVEDEIKVGSVEANAELVNEVNPFNPVGSDDEIVEEVKPKRGRKKKGNNE